MRRTVSFVALRDGMHTHAMGFSGACPDGSGVGSCSIPESVAGRARRSLGMGWGVDLRPFRLSALLVEPDGADPVAILCLGPVPDLPRAAQLEISPVDARPSAESNSFRRTAGPRPQPARLATC